MQTGAESRRSAFVPKKKKMKKLGSGDQLSFTGKKTE
jgi:hypothetical protein